MIEEEIKALSSELGVPVSTVEKDYAISWMLYGLWKSKFWRVLAFKGGTCLKKAYFADYRFSEDLDYTLLLEEPDIGDVQAKIAEAVEAANEGPVQFLDFELRPRYGVKLFPGELLGFEVRIPFRLLSRTGNPPKIKMDITLEKYEKILLPLQERPILHGYSDSPRFSVVSVRTYSLEEILAEKIRSLFQRTRPRDLYDIWFLKSIADLRSVTQILRPKFEAKGVEPDINALQGRKPYYERAWESSLGHQLRELPEFSTVWNDVLELVKEVLSNLGSFEE
ncbi:nucleotidyl transferase AbiEii/AbiGii toxin family protein [Thermococcus henrietii]|uniref:nucleotidyl transferase AbiEii/AbiGii toxin family protein n=1 Tax=Thermococcus henrietii TaxID=2016361 RepID=UPI000C072055|nr:nucleotidyl transferase AbiEii/AbiGii toxin family protein [Thermococcus henrietii]